MLLSANKSNEKELKQLLKDGKEKEKPFADVVLPFVPLLSPCEGCTCYCLGIDKENFNIMFYIGTSSAREIENG